MHSPAEVEVTIRAEVSLPDGVDEGSITSLVTYVLAAEGVSGSWLMGVEFIDDAAMQRAHAEFMDIDAPTDIMTFPYGDDDDDPVPPGTGWPETTPGGDLMISVDRAAENARDAGWSTEQELLFLVVHGVLHLLGWDDGTDEERRAMLERQDALLSGWQRSPEATQ